MYNIFFLQIICVGFKGGLKMPKKDIREALFITFSLVGNLKILDKFYSEFSINKAILGAE